MFVLTPCDELGCVGVFLDEEQMHAGLPRNKKYAVYKWVVTDDADHVYIIPYARSDLPCFVTDNLEVAKKYQQDLAPTRIIATDSPEYWYAEIGKMIPSALARLAPQEDVDLSEIMETISGSAEEDPTFHVLEMVVPFPSQVSPASEDSTSSKQ